MSERLLKISGNALLKEVAAWMAGNATFPMQSESPNPKIPRAWLNVTHFQMRQMVR